MTRTLVRLALAVALALGLGLAFGLGFDESGFDFSDSGIATAYISLSNVGGGLVVHFTDAAVAGAVATIDVDNEVLGFDPNDHADAMLASKVQASLGNADAFSRVSLRHCDCDFAQMSFTHEEQALPQVEAAYAERLVALGYELTALDGTTNIHAYQAVRGPEFVRLVFARKGAGTVVTLGSR